MMQWKKAMKPLFLYSHTKDVYRIEVELCNKLIDTYDKASRQLYNLGLA